MVHSSAFTVAGQWRIRTAFPWPDEKSYIVPRQGKSTGNANWNAEDGEQSQSATILCWSLSNAGGFVTNGRVIRWLVCVALAAAMAGYAVASPAWAASAADGHAADELTVGEHLPQLQGEYLSGRKATLPGDAGGRVALLLVGFSYASRVPVKAWTQRFRADFSDKAQVTFYQVPMLGGMARMGKWFIEGGMRRGTATADYENVITVYGGTEAWRQRLGVKPGDAKAEDTAYLVLLDRNGNVVWLHAGPLEESAYQALAAQVRKLIGGP